MSFNVKRIRSINKNDKDKIRNYRERMTKSVYIKKKNEGNKIKCGKMIVFTRFQKLVKQNILQQMYRMLQQIILISLFWKVIVDFPHYLST